MSLPNIVMVYEEKENDGTKYLIANRNNEEAMGGSALNEKRLVGVYKLVGKSELINVTQRVTKKTKCKAPGHGSYIDMVWHNAKHHGGKPYAVKRRAA